MGKRLFVGGIALDTTVESLKNHFEQAGVVEVVEIQVDKFTKRSRGFGFVVMGSEAEALNAIELLNMKDLQGRVLMVNEALGPTFPPPLPTVNKLQERISTVKAASPLILPPPTSSQEPNYSKIIEGCVEFIGGLVTIAFVLGAIYVLVKFIKWAWES